MRSWFDGAAAQTSRSAPSQNSRGWSSSDPQPGAAAVIAVATRVNRFGAI